MESNQYISYRLRKTKSTELGPESKSDLQKPRSKSVSALTPAYSKRDSFDPGPTAQERDESITLLRDNKRGMEFFNCVYAYIYVDHLSNEAIQAGFNYLIIYKDFVLSLQHIAETRHISNPFQQAARICVDVLWGKYLRPICKELQFKPNSEEIDFIIQAMLNEFTATNPHDSKNAMLNDSSAKLDSEKLFNSFKNKINDKETYQNELKKMRIIIKQIRIKKSQINIKNQKANSADPTIENLRVPKKGNFINEKLFIIKLAESLFIDEKDLGEIPPIIFQLIRSIATNNKSFTLINIQENEPFYFKEEELRSLFAKIKLAFKKLLGIETHISNQELIKAINKEIKKEKDPKDVKQAISTAVNTWLTEELALQNKNPKATELSKEIFIEEEEPLSPSP